MFKELFESFSTKTNIMITKLEKALNKSGIKAKRDDKINHASFALDNGIKIGVASEFNGMYTIYQRGKEIVSADSTDSVIEELDNL